jgi:hypothetical protein
MGSSANLQFLCDERPALSLGLPMGELVSKGAMGTRGSVDIQPDPDLEDDYDP